MQSRILIVDDNPSIHEDYRKILTPRHDYAALGDMEAALFGHTVVDWRSTQQRFELVVAKQGEEALQAVQQAMQEQRSFALAFIDMRMPPGWDGLETVERLWQVDPELQVVICTAYSDHPWHVLMERLGVSDRWLILKKPFDGIEVMQLAHALSCKWALEQAAPDALMRLRAAPDEWRKPGD
ncbi:MAG: response regulator [Gammaproteobacteria bacterium]|nr:response regulator [Gammaproteobacteria bacterium]